METSSLNETHRFGTKARIALVLALTTIAVTLVVLKRNAQNLADQRVAAVTLAESGQKLRDELLELYVQRVDLAQGLLKSIGGSPLKSEWIKTNSWRTSTPEDLATLDRDQNLISNHVAQFMSKIQLYSESAKKTAPSKKAEEMIRQAQNFERFEQDLVRKRRDYTQMAVRFAEQFKDLRSQDSLKNDPDFSEQKFPLFPAERELLEKTRETTREKK